MLDVGAQHTDAPRSSQTWMLSVSCFPEEGSGSEDIAMPAPGDVYPQKLWAHTGALQTPQEHTYGTRQGHGKQVASKKSLSHKSPPRCYHDLEQRGESGMIVLIRAVHWASRGCRAGEM